MATCIKVFSIRTWMIRNFTCLAALTAFLLSMGPFLFGANYFSGDFYHVHMPFEYAYKSFDKNLTLPTWLPFFQGGRATFGDMANSYSPFNIDFFVTYVITKFLGLDQSIGLLEINTWRIVLLNIVFALGCRRLAREVLESRHSPDFVFLITLFVGGFFLPHRPIFITCNTFSPWVLLYATKMGTRGSERFLRNATGFSLAVAAGVFHQFNIQSTLIWPYIGFYIVSVWFFCFGKKYWKAVCGQWQSMKFRFGILIVVATIISSALPLAWEYNYFKEYNGKMLYPGETIEALSKESVYDLKLISDERFEWQKLLSLFFSTPKLLGAVTNVDKGMPGFFIHNFQYLGSLAGFLLIVAIFFGRNRFKVPIIFAILAYILFSTVAYFPLFGTAMKFNYPMTRHFLFTQLHLAPLLAILAGMGMDRLLKLNPIALRPNLFKFLYLAFFLIFLLEMLAGQFVLEQGDRITKNQEYFFCLMIILGSLSVLVGSLFVFKRNLRFSLLFFFVLLDLFICNRIAHKFTINILGGDDQILYMHAFTFQTKPKDISVLKGFSLFSPLRPDAYTRWEEPHFYFPELFRYGVVGNKSFYDVYRHTTEGVRNMISGFTLPRLLLVPHAIADSTGEIAREVLSTDQAEDIIHNVVFLNDKVGEGRQTFIPENSIGMLDQSAKFSVSEELGYHKILPQMVTTNIPLTKGAVGDFFSDGNSLAFETKTPLPIDKYWWIQVDFGEKEIVNLVKTNHEYSFNGRPAFLEASHDLLTWKRIGFLTSADIENISLHSRGWYALNNDPHRYYRVYIKKSNPVIQGKHLPQLGLGYKVRTNSFDMKTRVETLLPLLRFRGSGLSPNKKYFIFSAYLPYSAGVDLTTNPDLHFAYDFQLEWLTASRKEPIILSPTWEDDWHSDGLFQIGYEKDRLFSINVPIAKIISQRKATVDIKMKSIESESVVLNYGPNSLLAKVENKKPSWLYFADTWDEYWTAKVGKISTPVHKANLQFKAIYLPPGKHLVEFKHEPNSFWNLVLFGYFFQIIALILWRKTRLSPSMTPLG